MSEPLHLLLEHYDETSLAASIRAFEGRPTVDHYHFHTPKQRGELRDAISEKLRCGHEEACEITVSIAKASALLLLVRAGDWPPSAGLDAWMESLEGRLQSASRELAAVALAADSGKAYDGSGDLLLALAPFSEIDRARELAKSLHAREPRIQTEPLSSLSFLASLRKFEGAIVTVAVSSGSSLVTLVHKGALIGADSLPMGLDQIFAAVQKQLKLKFIGSAAKLVFDGIYDFSEIASPILKEFSGHLNTCVRGLATSGGVQPSHLLLTRLPPLARWIETELSGQLELSVLPLASLAKPPFADDAKALEEQRGFFPLWQLAENAGATAFDRVDWNRAKALPDVLKALPAASPAAPKAAAPPAPAKPEPKTQKTKPEPRPQAKAKQPPASKPEPKPAAKAASKPEPEAAKKRPAAAPVPATGAEPAASNERKKPVPMIIAGAIAALLVLGIIMFFVTRGEGEDAPIALAPPAPVAPVATSPPVAPAQTVAADPEPTEKAEPSGRLVVRSQPEGATVLLNGEPAGLTPLRLDSVAAGSHNLSLELSGHESIQSEIEIADGGFTETEELQLRPFSGSLAIRSTPEGATVRLGGQRVGVTPLQLEDISPGEHSITLELDGFEPEAIVATVSRNETTTTGLVALRPFSGSLRIDSQPQGIAFRIPEREGQPERSGATPASFDNLPVGSYRVIFERDEWPNFTRPATIGHNEVTEVLMEYPEANVVLISEPPGAEVWQDDTLLGTTPLTLTGLRPQRMRCVLKLEGHLAETAILELEPNGEHNHNIDLISLDRVFSPDEVDVLPRPGDNVMPEVSANLHRQETVQVRFVVNREGRPESVTIRSSTNNRLNNVVLESVNDWIFEPAVLRDTPVKMAVVAPIVFKPAERSPRAEN